MSTETILYGGREVPRRPRESDDCVLGDVFYAILPELAGECGWRQEQDASDIAEARTQFIACAKHDRDGYSIMRELEDRYSWAGNSVLVDIFENAPYRKHLCAHVQKWINRFNIEPLRQVGEVVTFPHGREELRGVIEATESLFEPGMYVVRVAGMDGSPLLRWEECEKV